MRDDGKLWNKLKPEWDELPAGLEKTAVAYTLINPKKGAKVYAVFAVAAPCDFLINLDDVPGDTRENYVIERVPDTDPKTGAPKTDAKGRAVLKRISVKKKEAMLKSEGGWIRGFAGDFLCFPEQPGPPFACERGEFIKRYRPMTMDELGK